MGCDPLSAHSAALISQFQSTHPCGVRRVAISQAASADMFQSTHPCGVRLCPTIYRIMTICFNPRTRVGCDVYNHAQMLEQRAVSIHAPVWGATVPFPGHQFDLSVSIHAPVWGATVVITVPCSCNDCFNPRTRVGCDSSISPNWNSLRVSIHAPVWGATVV